MRFMALNRLDIPRLFQNPKNGIYIFLFIVRLYHAQPLRVFTWAHYIFVLFKIFEIEIFPTTIKGVAAKKNSISIMKPLLKAMSVA